MIVADVSTIATLWFPSDHSDAVKELLKNDSRWSAPGLWRSEFRNILAGYVRANKLHVDEVLEVWNEAEGLMKWKDYSVNTVSVLSLVSRSSCSAYDCEYIALAKELDTNLITYNEQLIREFPDVAMTAEQYLKKNFK